MNPSRAVGDPPGLVHVRAMESSGAGLPVGKYAVPGWVARPENEPAMIGVSSEASATEISRVDTEAPPIRSAQAKVVSSGLSAATNPSWEES